MSENCRWFPEDCKRRGGHLFAEWSGFYAPYPLRLREWLHVTGLDLAEIEFSAYRTRICACCGKIEQESYAKANGLNGGSNNG